MSPDVSRRTFLGGAVGGVLAVSGAASGAAAAAPGALWAEFVANPYAHPQIPYVGRAGCLGGVAELPDPPVAADARDYGADPTGAADSSTAINRALAEVGAAGGGTVLLPAGTYRVDDVIRVGHSGVVLRGAGSGATVLRSTRSLTELIGPNGSRYGGDKSAWSWSGGLVWICPEARWTSLTDAIRAQDWPFEGWTGNVRDAWRTLTAVTGSPRRGDHTVPVAEPGALRPGDRVLLRLHDDQAHTLLTHIAGDIDGAAGYDWDACTKLLSYLPYEWPCVVVAVDEAAGTVTLDRPLPLDARADWAPEFTTLVDPVIGSGVAGLTLEFPELPQPEHLLDQGHNGVALQCAWDCFVDDVRVVNADNGFLLVAAKACTLRRTAVAGRASHHPYCCREGSHDNLVQDFAIEEPTVPLAPGAILHGINTEGLSSHNVWSRGRMATGTFDTHRGMPFASVRTEIVIDNDGAHGGDASAGPLYGARFAHWNVTVTNERAGCVRIDGIAPYSATVAISEVREFGQIDVPDFAGPLHTRLESYGHPETATPPNLHEAQRALSR